MKVSYLGKLFLPAGFALGLAADPLGFTLTAPDNSMAGHGMIETKSDNTIQVQVVAQAKEFSGIGSMSEVQKTNKALRSDRAFLELLGKDRKKRGLAWLEAKDGAKLACEFNIDDAHVDGRCINAANQQVFTVHSSTGNQP